MTLFSTTATRVVEAFAANMGLTAIAAADHSYGFEFTRFGRLSIVPAEDGERVIICLARLPHRADALSRRRLFSLAGFNFSHNAMIHAGIAPDGSFTLAMDVEEARFDVQMLDEALSTLNELHDLTA
jgi:hypothetical protein